MTTTPQITGLRMMDVRVQVATQDGRRWEVTEACGHWHGAVA
jgi:hypothetical protein